MQGRLHFARADATGWRCRSSSAAAGRMTRPLLPWRQPLRLQAKFSNPFDGMFGGKGGDPDAARRAIERSLGGGKGKQQPGGAGAAAGKPPPQPQQPGRQAGSSTGGGGFGGGLSNLSSLFGGGSKDAAAAAPGGGGRAGLGGGDGSGSGSGSGGGGGWNWGGSDDAGASGSGGERPISAELADLLRGIWVVFWNAALFLAFADVLHRSLDWCCQVELLLLVGAPAQAWERVASRLYAALEWFEANVLGWKLPADEDTMPLYKQLALFYPEEHAYTFDAYRYNMTEEEKRTLKRYYALRWWERDGGRAGDVTPAQVAAIKDKYAPRAAELRAYADARANGQLAQYWAGQAQRLRELTGDASPPATASA